MLRNSTDIFISQSRQRKFLDTLEELIKSGRSTPVVTDRLLEIIAAAAYASGRHSESSTLGSEPAFSDLVGKYGYADTRPTEKGSEKDGFRGLWLRVKPADKPDEVRIDVLSGQRQLTFPIRASHSTRKTPCSAHPQRARPPMNMVQSFLQWNYSKQVPYR
jgi:hypothetical protein